MRRDVVGPKGIYSTETIGEREVYLQGTIYRPKMVEGRFCDPEFDLTDSELEDLDKMIEEFEAGPNLARRGFETLGRGDIEIKRRVRTKFKTEYEISDEEMDKLMDLGLGSGVGYWCMGVRVKKGDIRKCQYASHIISRGGALYLYAENTDERWILNKEKLLDGLNMYLNCMPIHKLKIEDMQVKVDNRNITDADCIIQCAIFGKIRFS